MVRDRWEPTVSGHCIGYGPCTNKVMVTSCVPIRAFHYFPSTSRVFVHEATNKLVSKPWKGRSF